ERALVDQQVDLLARRQLAGVVLLLDLLGAPAELRALPTGVELLGQLGERRGSGQQILARRLLRFTSGGGGVSGRLCHRPFHTGSRFSKKAATPSMASSVA